VAHVSAGNVPGLAIPTIVTGLLAKAAVVVKPAAGDPVLAALVARSLASIDPDLGDCVAVAYWPGGTDALTDVLLRRTEVVTVEGDDATVAAVTERARGRVLGFGRRLSCALVTREATADLGRVVAGLARDVSLYDQHGCLSPQVVYVETGGPASALDVAAALGRALVELEHELPRGPLSPEAHQAVRALREAAEWNAIAGQEVRIFGSPAASGVTVLYEADPTFAPAAAYRTVRVKPLEEIAGLMRHLGPWAGCLEAVGVAGSMARRHEVTTALAPSSVSRICPVGRMQSPPLGWHRGGVARLQTLLRWVDVEEAPPPASPGSARVPAGPA
jgi:hypothetical protein